MSRDLQCFSLYAVPEPPEKPPEVDEMEDIKLELPPDESLVSVTLRWVIPLVTGGDLTSFNVLLAAIGDVNAGLDSRRRRQTDNFLDDCIVPNTTNNNFTVAPDVTQLDVDASKEILCYCSNNSLPLFSQLHTRHMSIAYRQSIV